MLICSKEKPIANILSTKFYFKVILETNNHERKCVFQDKKIENCFAYLDRRFGKE